jgi:hypothetical protein
MLREIRRLVFVHGPWQLLIAAGALKQASQSAGDRSRDTLVVFSLHDGPLPAPIRDVIGQIAPAVWPWHDIIVLDDAIRHDVRDARAGTEAVRASLRKDPPDEVWLDCLWGTTEKFAAEAYPKARLVLYEDGLHTYLPSPDNHLSVARLLRDPRGTYHSLRLRYREQRYPDDLSLAGMLPRHLARVAASYLWISQMLPPADYHRRLPWVQLQTGFVRETLAQVSPLVDDAGLDSAGGPRAILLGHCFSNYGHIERRVELDFYVGMAGQLRGMGYEVIWKEHPRTREPFLTELLKAVPGVRGAPDWGQWPIELFVERLGLSACASIVSTSLFTIPLLFGLPSFAAAARYAPLLPFPDGVLARLVAQSIPQLEEGGIAPQARAFATAPTRTGAADRARAAPASEGLA